MVARFVERGLRVAGCARTEGQGATACEHFERLDLKNTDAIAPALERAWDALGGIDLVVNNAGVLGPVKPLRDVSIAQFREVLEVNLVAPVVVARAYRALLARDDRQGTLLNISSGAAISGYAGWSAYCASKAALDRVSECLFLEETPRMITRAVAPGVIDTDMQATVRAADERDFPMKEKFLNLKRDDAFSSTKHVADGLLEVAFADDTIDEMVLRLPPEDKQV